MSNLLSKNRTLILLLNNIRDAPNGSTHCCSVSSKLTACSQLIWVHFVDNLLLFIFDWKTIWWFLNHCYMSDECTIPWHIVELAAPAVGSVELHKFAVCLDIIAEQTRSRQNANLCSSTLPTAAAASTTIRYSIVRSSDVLQWLRNHHFVFQSKFARCIFFKNEFTVYILGTVSS